MKNRYSILNCFRIEKDESWEKFSERFADYGNMPTQTLHKVCTGRSTPNERTAAKLDRYIRDHRAELAEMLDEEQGTGKRLASPSGHELQEVAVGGTVGQ